MSRPFDHIEMLGGAVDEFRRIREVARLANLAGLDGYQVADIDIGNFDREAALTGDWRVYITISYKEKGGAE